MYLTQHFVFLHVPRTGGNFVRVLLEQHAPADWRLQRQHDHATVAEIPASHQHLPRLAIVRNPYAWYVSWFHFQQKTRDAFFLEVSDGGRLGFQDSLRNALQSRDALQRGEGPFTQTIREMLGHDVAGVHVGKFERLRSELLRLFGLCVAVPPGLAAAIQALPVQNASEHRHWRTYYDADLRDRIAAKDREALRFFGYSFDDPE